MSSNASFDTPAQAAITQDVVLRYHFCWKYRDLDGVMALYHPDVEYNDFFQNIVLQHADLAVYVRDSMPRHPQESLEHTDRIRFDGDTAFIQYQLTLRDNDGLVTLRASEAITVRDGLIWRINEYSSLVHQARTTVNSNDTRPAASRLGLSARQLGFLAQDLKHYFEREQPYLDPQLNLQQVAAQSGYSRNQISYLLNQVLGLSFYRYVNQARLQHLLSALATSPQATKIDDLAYAAGFNSLSAFYSCFRQHIGLSPKAFLKLDTQQQNSLRARTQDKG
jgi:AraC-like DNA-binding protein